MTLSSEEMKSMFSPGRADELYKLGERLMHLDNRDKPFIPRVNELLCEKFKKQGKFYADDYFIMVNDLDIQIKEQATGMITVFRSHFGHSQVFHNPCLAEDDAVLVPRETMEAIAKHVTI